MHNVLYNIVLRLFLSTIFVLIVGTVIVVNNNLANGVVSGKYFWFYGCMGLVSIVTLISSFFNKNFFLISLTDGFVIIFVGYVFLSTWFFNNVSENTSRLVILILLLVLYLSLRLTFDSNRNKLQFFCFIIIITGLFETIWGMMQLYGFSTSQHSLFKLTGSFFNPSPFAGYIAIVFPLALTYFCERKKHQPTKKTVIIDIVNNLLQFFKIHIIVDFSIPLLKKWLGIITCVATILVLPATMCRASWLALVAGSIVVIIGQQQNVSILKKNLFNHKNTRLKNVVYTLIISLMIFSFVGMYYLKKDSADGRLLIWKMSLFALVQHPLGVGLGHFPYAYGEVQSTYFASGNASETEKYVAGNPEYGFNEFLQITIESGIVAILFFIGILVCAFLGYIKSKNWGAMGSLVALIVFACFSYPFSVLPFLIVFVFLLAMSTTGRKQMKQVKQTITKSTFIYSIQIVIVPVLCLVITFFCLWIQYPVYNAYKQWKLHQRYYQANMYIEVVRSYELLYPYLNDQILFLFEYGRSLSQSEQPEKSNEVLQRAMQISCDPMLYNIMGKNYQAMKEYDLAEKSFRKATLIVPNRVYPYYLLMLLYIETEETEKQREIALIVLTKEPKVESTAIEEMREEARKIVISD